MFASLTLNALSISFIGNAPLHVIHALRFPLIIFIVVSLVVLQYFRRIRWISLGFGRGIANTTPRRDKLKWL
jgi:hypothetical protein